MYIYVYIYIYIYIYIIAISIHNYLIYTYIVLAQSLVRQCLLSSIRKSGSSYRAYANVTLAKKSSKH